MSNVTTSKNSTTCSPSTRPWWSAVGVKQRMERPPLKANASGEGSTSSQEDTHRRVLETYSQRCTSMDVDVAAQVIVRAQAASDILVRHAPQHIRDDPCQALRWILETTFSIASDKSSHPQKRRLNLQTLRSLTSEIDRHIDSTNTTTATTREEPATGAVAPAPGNVHPSADERVKGVNSPAVLNRARPVEDHCNGGDLTTTNHTNDADPFRQPQQSSLALPSTGPTIHTATKKRARTDGPATEVSYLPAAASMPRAAAANTFSGTTVPHEKRRHFDQMKNGTATEHKTWAAPASLPTNEMAETHMQSTQESLPRQPSTDKARTDNRAVTRLAHLTATTATSTSLGHERAKRHTNRTEARPPRQQTDQTIRGVPNLVHPAAATTATSAATSHHVRTDTHTASTEEHPLSPPSAPTEKATTSNRGVATVAHPVATPTAKSVSSRNGMAESHIASTAEVQPVLPPTDKATTDNRGNTALAHPAATAGTARNMQNGSRPAVPQATTPPQLSVPLLSSRGAKRKLPPASGHASKQGSLPSTAASDESNRNGKLTREESIRRVADSTRNYFESLRTAAATNRSHPSVPEEDRREQETSLSRRGQAPQSSRHDARPPRKRNASMGSNGVPHNSKPSTYVSLLNKPSVPRRSLLMLCLHRYPDRVSADAATTKSFVVKPDKERISGILRPRTAAVKVSIRQPALWKQVGRDILSRFEMWDPYWEFTGPVLIGKICHLTNPPGNAEGLNTAMQQDFTPITDLKPDDQDVLHLIPFPDWYNPKPQAWVDGKYYVIFRMLTETPPQEGERADGHIWPKGTFLQIDGQPRAVAQRRQQQHDPAKWSHTRGQSELLDVTACVSDPRDQHSLEVCCVDEKPFFYCISICMFRSPDTLFRCLTKGESPERIGTLGREAGLSKIKALALDNVVTLDGASESNETSKGIFVFSLKCPISQVIIETPVRGKRCKHFQVGSGNMIHFCTSACHLIPIFDKSASISARS